MPENIHFFAEDVTYNIRQKKLIRQWISESITQQGFVPGEINIILCSDDYLYKMNIEYLDHDTFTDIITFDYTEDREISGDLFISLDRVRENARQFSKNLTDELHRVMIHGVLHLCGFGDKTKKEKDKMTENENINLSRRPDQLRGS